MNCFDPCYFRNHRPILLTDLWGVVDFPNALSSTQTNLLNVFFLSQMGISKNKKEQYVYVPLLLLKRNKLLGSQVSPRLRSYFTLDYLKVSRDHRANISVFYRFRVTKKRCHLVEGELNTRPLLTRAFFPSRTANSNLMSLKAHTDPLLAFYPQQASIVTTFYKDLSVFNTAVCLSIHQSKLGISYQAWFRKGSLKGNV